MQPLLIALLLSISAITANNNRPTQTFRTNICEAIPQPPVTTENNILSAFIITSPYSHICTLPTASIFKLTDTSRTRTYPEIGWTVAFPPQYILAESDDDNISNERGSDVQSNNHKIPNSKSRVLFSLKKDNYNYLNATLTPFEGSPAGWKASNDAIKKLLYQNLQQKVPNTYIDSSTISSTISGVVFDKFSMFIRDETRQVFKMSIYSRVMNNYELAITYVALDEASQAEMETMIKRSVLKGR